MTKNVFLNCKTLFNSLCHALPKLRILTSVVLNCYQTSKNCNIERQQSSKTYFGVNCDDIVVALITISKLHYKVLQERAQEKYEIIFLTKFKIKKVFV